MKVSGSIQDEIALPIALGKRHSHDSAHVRRGDRDQWTEAPAHPMALRRMASVMLATQASTPARLYTSG